MKIRCLAIDDEPTALEKLKAGTKILRVDFDDIMYVEGMNEYLKIHPIGGIYKEAFMQYIKKHLVQK